MRNNAVLRRLVLSNNQLMIPPDVRGNTALRTLDLSGNRLREISDISGNPRLSFLFLTNNDLTTLPDAIFNMAAQSWVDADKNLFSVRYIEAFQERLRAHRLQYPGQGPQVLMYPTKEEEREAGLPLQHPAEAGFQYRPKP